MMSSSSLLWEKTMDRDNTPLPGLAPDGRRDEFFYLCAINRATLVTNAAAGLVAPEKATAYAKAIDAVTKTGVRTDRVIKLEPQLIAIAGPEITELHVGRSSQDMHAAYRLAMLRDDVLALLEALSGLIADFTNLAEKNRDVIVPNYTNGVAAQPNSFGHYLLGVSEGLVRDRERLMELYRRANRSPMGATVLNGTGWPLNRRRMAEKLGFDGIVENAFDATQGVTADLPLEFTQVLQSAALHCAAFIQDVMQQYAEPRPWMILAEGDDTTYVSSAMPQKRNPGLMNNTRTLASEVAAGAVEAAFLMHNTVTGMQDAKNVAPRRAVAEKALSLFAGMRKILKALKVNPERALEELNSDWTATQEVADELMRKHHVPFRVGHHAASAMVTYARANNLTPLTFPYAKMAALFREVTAKEWHEEAFPMTEDEFHAALDPRRIVANRATEGGPQSASLAALFASRRKANDKAAQFQEDAQQRVTRALAALDREFAAFLP